MIQPKIKFSDCVGEFVLLWIEWLKHNNIAISSDHSYAERRKASKKAEQLLNKRYWLTQQIDSYFDGDK